MVGTPPNFPGGREPADAADEVQLVASGGDVRELQRNLWVAAKRSPGRRFHALFDRIWRSRPSGGVEERAAKQGRRRGR